MRKGEIKFTQITIVFLVSVALGFGCLSADRAMAQSAANGPGVPTPRTDVYAVKFVCGIFRGNGSEDEGPVKPGNYLTAINVHNPSLLTVSFKKKALMLYPSVGFEVPMPPGEFRFGELKPDWGLEIDCADIRQVLLSNQVQAPAFIKGFVVIEVSGKFHPPLDPLPLDVVAVYTAHGFFVGTSGALQPEGFSLDVEKITPTRR